jgi:DUF4097 and DUF4098 domain-containing protein YvlB
MRFLSAVVLSTLTLAGCEVNLNSQGLSTREVKTFAVKGQPEVSLDTFDGAIELHSWDRNEVEIEVERRANEQSLIDQITVSAEQHGDAIILKVTGPSRIERHGLTIGVDITPQARLRVALPRNANISATSGDGSIRAEAIDGKITLHTTDGSIVASRLSGDIELRSGDGSIRLEDVSGKLDLETTDGSIGLDAKPTVLRAKTGDGSIRATIRPDTVMADNWDLSTSDGSVVVTLPGTFNAELDAETSDGVVRAKHPLIAGERDEHREDGSRESRRSLRQKMGEGGKTLRLRTGDGTIRIER